MTTNAASLLKLPADWDSYGAPRIDPVAVRRAEALVRLLTAHPAQFVPTSDGGVSVEWYTPDGEMVVSFTPILDGLFLRMTDGEAEAEWER